MRPQLLPSPRSERLLLAAVDACLAVLVFGVPLLLGGRIALGQMVLVAAAVTAAVCWMLRQALAKEAAWTRSPVDWLVAAALVVIGVQLVPLPEAVLATLSPKTPEILPLWTSQGETAGALGPWTTLSLAPSATRACFVLVLAFGLAALVAAQRIQRVDDVERLIRWTAWATLGMAGFALVQYFTSNGTFFWFYEHPYAVADDNVKGSFTNRNHFAQFIALGIGPMVWWLLEERKRKRRPLVRSTWRAATRETAPDTFLWLKLIAVAAAVFAGLLSLSRGGAMAMAVATIVCLVILHRGRMVGRQALIGAGAVGLLVVVGLGIFGYEMLASRLDDFTSLESLDGSHTRRRIWQADLAAMADFPLLGTGLGSHREVYPLYLKQSGATGSLELTHAESGYVQIAMETGLAGLAVLLATLGCCAVWCGAALRRSPDTRVLLCLAAIVPALAASLLHALADFTWYVPGCMVGVVLLAVCAWRLGRLTRPETGSRAAAWRVPRAGWLAMAGCLAVLGGLMVHDRLLATLAEPSWHRYLKLSRDDDKLQGDALWQRLESMRAELTETLRWRGDNARAHARLASVHLRMFDHPQDAEVAPMDVRQVGDAVLASAFPSRGAMDAWLDAAFGERRKHLDAALRHVRQGLRLCPLQGDTYLHLANLAFLEGPRAPGAGAYVAQGLRVRPFDGAVLFTAGQDAALAGRHGEALRYWRASFACGPRDRQRLIEALAPGVPAAFLLQQFEPDVDALCRILRQYRRLKRDDQVEIVLPHYAEACVAKAQQIGGPHSVGRLLQAADAYRTMQHTAAWIACLEEAVRRDPSHFEARLRLGKGLLAEQQYPEAEKHLTWCRRQKPENENLRRLAAVAVEKRLRQAERPRQQRME